MIRVEEIRSAAKKIGKAARAKRVILFGSYANGTASEESDVDLLIVAESDLPRYKRSRDLYRLFKPYPFPMDLLVYTPGEIERHLSDPASFVSMVLKEGKEVYVG